MKRSYLMAAAVCILALTAGAAPATAQTAAPSPERTVAGRPASTPQSSGNDNLAVWLKQLVVEIRGLRRDLLEQRVESLETSIGQLQSELQEVESDQQRLPDEEQAQSHEIAALDEQLAQSTLSPDERAELETSRNELRTGGVKQLRAEKLSLAQRSAKLRERLHQAQQRLLSLTEKAKGMGFVPESH